MWRWMRKSKRAQKANIFLGKSEKEKTAPRKRENKDYSVLPRSLWCTTDTHQGVRWQNALSINMLLRRNKTSPRASTLHANFIRAAMQERHLCMQMRELSISKLQLVPAKCVIMDVGCLCCNTHPNVWSLLSWILRWSCKWMLRIFETTTKWSVLKMRYLSTWTHTFWQVFAIKLENTMGHEWND